MNDDEGLPEESARPRARPSESRGDGHTRNPFEESLGHIVADIRSGAIPHGSRLPAERELAEQFGVGRSTIRAVIRALQQAGLVRTQRGRTGGSFVTWEQRDDRARSQRLNDQMRTRLLDMLRFRSVLEPGAAELAAERGLAAPEEARLRELLATATTAGPAFRAGDAELHIYIAELAECRALHDAIVNIQLILNETLLEVVPVMGPALEHSHRLHADLVDAIVMGERARARAIMSVHVDATAQLLSSFLD